MFRILCVSILFFGLKLVALEGEVALQTGHTGRVLSVAFSPDGKYLVSGGQEGSLRVWEVQSGKIIYNKAHGGPVHSISFSPDGKTFASASMDGKIRFYDMNTGKLSREMPGTTWWDERHVGTVYFSKDWKYVAIIKFEKPANWPVKCNTVTEIREVENWKLLCSHPSRYDAQGICVAFSPDNKFAGLGFRGYENVKLMEIATGKIIQEFGVGYIYFVAFSEDGKVVAACDRSGRITWWDTATGKNVGNLKITEPYNWSNWSQFSPDGRFFISGHDGSEIRFWDAKTAEKLFELEGGSAISHLDISKDGKFLATAVRKTIQIWDIESKKLIHTLGKELDIISSTSFSKDGRFIAFAGKGGMINLYDTEDGQYSSVKASTLSINSIAFSLDNKLIAAGTDEQSVTLWEIPSLKKLYSLVNEQDWEIVDLAFSPDGKFLATSSRSEKIRIWDVSVRRVIRSMDLPHRLTPNFAYSLAFSPDGKLLAAGSRFSDLMIWDVGSGQVVLSAKVCTEEPESSMDYDKWTFRQWVYGLSFSPDGKFIATGEWGGWRNGYIRIWDVKSGEMVRKFATHKVICLAYLPDGKFIASGGNDNRIRLWDVGSGKEISSLEGHSDFVTSLSFSSDNKYLVSASWDGTARVWDINSKNLLLTLLSPEQGEFIAYTPQSYYRSSEGAKKYILFTSEGKIYTPAEYESNFGWKNEPEKVVLPAE